MLKRTSSQAFVGDFAVLIGALGKQTGIATSALRYWERVGLLSPAGRSGGRRYYGANGIERVAFIQLCRDAGFTLREIRALLATGSRRSRKRIELLAAKVAELETRIAQTERAKVLVQHALACPHPSFDECPKFRAALRRQVESTSDPGARRRGTRRRTPPTT
jgi:DNA-binding transcriptional MerR regulator